MRRLAAKVLVIALAAVLGHPAPASAGMDEGVRAYNAGDFAAAFGEFIALAEAGNVAAQYNVAQMYRNGKGVAQDYPAALKWYEKAAEAGLSSAQNNLAQMIVEGKGTEVDYARAVGWWHRAARQDYVSAQFNLGTAYLNGLGVAADKEEALFWYSLAMVNGYAGARPIREELAGTMKVEQLLAVTERVKQWQPKSELPPQ